LRRIRQYYYFVEILGKKPLIPAALNHATPNPATFPAELAGCRLAIWPPRAFMTEFGPVLGGRQAAGPETVLVRFKDLTGRGELEVWRRVLAHLGLDLPNCHIPEGSKAAS
jgi:hypothetical protein